LTRSPRNCRDISYSDGLGRRPKDAHWHQDFSLGVLIALVEAQFF
jgi:hypothetical protein